MKRNLFLWQLGGFAFACFAGTLLHFWYGWSGESLWVAPFSAVNESTWEHMKLLFFPCFLFALVQGFFVRERGFWQKKLGGTLLGLGAIPVLFYTLNGAFGKTSALVNIAIFFVSAALVYRYEYFALQQEGGGGGLFLACFCLLGALFVIFTFAVPQIPLFCDPVTGLYGSAKAV